MGIISQNAKSQINFLHATRSRCATVLPFPFFPHTYCLILALTLHSVWVLIQSPGKQVTHSNSNPATKVWSICFGLIGEVSWLTLGSEKSIQMVWFPKLVQGRSWTRSRTRRVKERKHSEQKESETGGRHKTSPFGCVVGQLGSSVKPHVKSGFTLNGFI